MYLQKQKNPLGSKYPLGITALGHQCTRLNAGVLNGWAYVGNRTTVCPIERSFSRGQKWAGLHIKQRMQLFWCASCAETFNSWHLMPQIYFRYLNGVKALYTALSLAVCWRRCSATLTLYTCCTTTNVTAFGGLVPQPHMLTYRMCDCRGETKPAMLFKCTWPLFAGTLRSRSKEVI